MLKYFAAVLVLILGALGAMYFWIGVPKIYEEAMPTFAAPHMYENPERSITAIEIKAFYFIPRNKTDRLAENWRELTVNGIEKLRDFHRLQLQGRSEITYKVYPEPIIGREDNLSYDTLNTERGNPYALINVTRELQERVFDPEGDLNLAGFAKRPEDAYPVILIIYEGVGASGGVINDSDLETHEEIARFLGLPEEAIFLVELEAADGFMLINRGILAGDYGPSGASVLAHEFYHTLGVPDGYEKPHGTPTSEDLMGSGLTRAIERTYLERETLRALGL